MSEPRARIVSDPHEWRALLPAWDRLLATIPDGTPLQSARFLDLWWTHLAGDKELYVVVVEADGAPVAFLPLQRRAVRRLGKRYRVIELMGMPNELLRPALAISARPDAFLPVALAALAARPRDWDAIDLEELVLSTDQRRALDGLEQPGFFGVEVRRLPFHPCPVLALDRSFADYVSGLSRIMRRKLRYLRNKLERSGKVDLELYTASDEVAQGLDTFVEIESRSWKPGEGVGVGSDRAVRTFYEALLRDYAATGRARVLVLRLDGAPIAGTFGITESRTYYAMQIAHDRAFDHLSPGTLLESFELEGLMGEGAFDRYEFFGGALANKQRWTRDQVETERVYVERRGLHPRLYDGLRRIARVSAAPEKLRQIFAARRSGVL